MNEAVDIFKLQQHYESRSFSELRVLAQEAHEKFMYAILHNDELGAKTSSRDINLIFSVIDDKIKAYK